MLRVGPGVDAPGPVTAANPVEAGIGNEEIPGHGKPLAADETVDHVKHAAAKVTAMPSRLATLRRVAATPWVRLAALVIYYLAILLILLLMYGRGDFNSPPFIYRGL